MRAHELLREIGDKPYPLGSWKYGQTQTRLPSGEELRINFEELGLDYVLLSFSVGERVDTTGRGDAVKILSTVEHALDTYVRDSYPPQLIVFAAHTDDVSRIKLFDRSMNRLTNLPHLRGMYVNLTNRPDLWPHDLRSEVRSRHGDRVKIYVLASGEYLHEVRDLLSENILHEAALPNLLPPDMIAALEVQGYKRMGEGAEHSVWLGPDGYAYKIMPPRYIRSETVHDLHLGNISPQQLYITHSQRAFLDWVDFCRSPANRNNPFLPYYDDWQTYVREHPRLIRGKRSMRYYVYLQCRTERLFELPTQWRDQMLRLSIRILNGDETASEVMNDPEGIEELLVHMGDDFPVLHRTLRQLEMIADAKNYRIDLHAGNFMLGSDGQIVINDPFFVDYTARVR